MKRVKIYTIEVTRTEEKLLMFFKLPEDAMVINGICVSSDAYGNVENKNAPNIHVGNISLTIPETGDVFFNEMVKGNHINDVMEYRLSTFLNKQFNNTWNNSIGLPPLWIHLIDTTFITAYYEDFINKPEVEPVKYHVRVYLHYST